MAMIIAAFIKRDQSDAALKELSDLGYMEGDISVFSAGNQTDSSASAGNLSGELTKLGLTTQTAESFTTIVKNGGVVLGVPVKDQDMSETNIRAIFGRHEATDITAMQSQSMEPSPMNSDTGTRTSSQPLSQKPVFGEKLDSDDD